MATVQIPTVQRLVLGGIDWRTYRGLSRIFNERPGLRLTYDRGTLEIMTVSFGHESWAHLIGRFILVLTEELGLPVAGGGSTTFRRRRNRRGLEPDQCYWVQHEAQVRGRDRIDLRTDPPPDLAIEVDISPSALDRMGIYATLGVPEVWCFEGRVLTFQVLGSNGQYAPSSHSAAFPTLASADLAPFLALRGQVEENALVRQFRAWVRQSLAGGAPASPTP